MFKKSGSGFSLIELLVIIAIVGILATIIAVGINPLKRIGQARDASRKQHVSDLKKALQYYFIDNSVYPDAGADLFAESSEGDDWISGLRPDYLKTLPKDPKQAGLPSFTAFGGFIEKFGGKINDVFAVGTSYYVDCAGGSDTNNGTSQASAWKTLGKANTATLVAGDSLLLKRGCTWVGPLKAKWNGTSAAVITVGAYGSGNLPHIRNTDASGNVVQITGSYQNIEYLEASNDSPSVNCATPSATNCNEPMDPAKCPPGSPQVGGQVLQPKGWRSGFRLDPTAHHNTIQNSKAHEGTVGVSMTFGSHHNKVLSNEFTNNTYMSVLTNGGDDDGGAMGIVLNGDDNEIAYNYFSGNNACTYDYGPDGISVEVYGSKRNNIHHNRTVNDYSFVEVGSKTTAPVSYTEDTTLAFNLMNSSLENAAFLNVHGTGVFGPTYRTAAYNNTAYLPGGSGQTTGSQAVMCSGCKVGGTVILTLRNNILVGVYKAVYSDVKFIDDSGYNRESNNIYYSPANSWWVVQVAGGRSENVDPTSKVINPQFVSSGSDFHLNSNSYGIDHGTTVSCVGCGPDLDGVSIPVGAAVDIGAYEAGGAAPSAVPSTAPSTAPSGGPSTAPSASPAVGTYLYRYVVSLDRKTFILWARLESSDDKDIYSKTEAACKEAPPTTNYNYCVQNL